MRILPVIFFFVFLSSDSFAYPSSGAEDHTPPFLKEFTIFPNPTSGEVTLTLETTDPISAVMTLKVYSLIGQEMMKESINPFVGTKKVQLDLGNLPRGLYMVEISDGDRSRIKRVSVR